MAVFLLVVLAVCGGAFVLTRSGRRRERMGGRPSDPPGRHETPVQGMKRKQNNTKVTTRISPWIRSPQAALPKSGRVSVRSG